MANIMYDYNKTRLMYGLRKLAQDQPKKEEKEQAAPPPVPSKQPEQDRISALGRQSATGPKNPAPAPAQPEQPAPTKKPGPNYNFTQQQLAAARKRRALITAVAGTVGFGTGYVANQMISDDPTLTGGLLTGGALGALAGGVAYSLSDPQEYLRNQADDQFRKNNEPEQGKDEPPAIVTQLDKLWAWAKDHPIAAAIGGGLGGATLWGEMKRIKERGLIGATTDAARDVKRLFTRGRGAQGQKTPQQRVKDSKKRVQKTLDAYAKGDILDGDARYMNLSDDQKALVDKHRKPGNQGAATAGEPTPGAKQTAAGTAAAAAAAEQGAGEPTPGAKQTTSDANKAVTPEVVTPEDTAQPKGKPAAGTGEQGNPASAEEARRKLMQQQYTQWINTYEDPAKAKQALAWHIIRSDSKISPERARQMASQFVDANHYTKQIKALPPGKPGALPQPTAAYQDSVRKQRKPTLDEIAGQVIKPGMTRAQQIAAFNRAAKQAQYKRGQIEAYLNGQGKARLGKPGKPGKTRVRGGGVPTNVSWRKR